MGITIEEVLAERERAAQSKTLEEEYAKRGLTAPSAASPSIAKTIEEVLAEREQAKLNQPKNQGGFLGGMEYMGTRVVDSLAMSTEGLVDSVVGGISYLIGLAGVDGAAKFAERTFRNDWYNYNRADEKYNPGPGWKFAGDVAGVVGYAIPDIAIGIATNGVGLGAKWAVKGISAGVNFLSTTGRGVSEATQKTGKLGAKEWAGGAGSGALASGIELLSGKLGDVLGGGWFGKTSAEMGSELAESIGKKASGEVVQSALGKATAKEATEEIGESALGKVVKSIWKSKTGRELAGEFFSEGGEEALETYLEPYIKQYTYDPDAAEATLGDVMQSFLLGGVGGSVISAGTKAVGSGVNAIIDSRANKAYTVTGAKISTDQARLQKLMSDARTITNYENEHLTGSAVFDSVGVLYEKVKNSLQTSGGSYTTSQLRDIGHLQALVTSSMFQPSAVDAAINIARNADRVAAMVSEYNQKVGGQAITAEQITKGLELNKGNKAFVRSVTSALKSNDVLRGLVLNSMVSRAEFDARDYANTLFEGAKISDVATRENINRFLAGADAQTLAKVGEALGITNWATVTPEELAARLRQFRESGASKAYEGGINAIRAARGTETYTNGLPSAARALSEGVTRFKSEGVDIAIIKEGGGYRLYDYESGHITRIMSEAELDELVQRIKDKQISFKEQSEMQRLDKEIGAFAEKNIPEYKNLTASEREVVRETLRFAREYGASRADQILYGRISAKSGLAIHLTDKVPGGDVAFFDGKNTIYLDANAPRTRSYKGLLGHEVWHKMFKSKRIKALFNSALNNIDPGKRAEVKETYIQHLRELGGRTEAEIENISDEEVAAAYAEELFNNPHVWDIVLDGEPTLKDRVLAFFKLAPKKYSFAPEMDTAAKEWIREYKKVFDQLKNNSLLEPNNNTFDSYDAENADSDGVTTTNQQNMQVSGRGAKKSNQSKFYEDKYYQRQIDRIDELKQGSYITVGEIPTGSPLNMVGFPNSVVYFDVSKIVKEMRTREDAISTETMKSIPKVLNAPIAITEYVDKNGGHSANVYGHLFVNNSPIVVGVMMKQTQKGNIISKIQTVHPNRNVLKEMTDDKILYLSENKKETKSWFQSLGTQQLPLGGKQFGFIRSISQNTQNDKGFDKNSSKNIDSGGRAALNLKPYTEIESASYEGEVKNSSKDGKAAKLKAQVFSDKVYKKSDIDKAVSNMRILKAFPKNTVNQLANDLWIALNEAKNEEARAQVARETIVKFFNYYSNAELDGLEPGFTAKDLVTEAAGELEKLLGVGSETYKAKVDAKAREYKAKVDAEAKERIAKETERANARADERTGKAKERLDEKYEKRQRELEARYTAEYLTDKVISKPVISSALKGKYFMEDISAKAKSKILNEIWYEFSYADGSVERHYTANGLANTVYDIVANENSKYSGADEFTLDQLYRDIKEAMREISYRGRESTRAFEERSFREKTVQEETERRKILTVIHDDMKRLTNEKQGLFYRASEWRGAEFKKSIDTLTRLEWRSDIKNTAFAKEALKGVANWYTSDNPMLKPDPDMKEVRALYSEEIAVRLNLLSNSPNNEFSVNELKMIHEVITYLTTLMKQYDKVYLEGKWQSGEKTVRRLHDIAERQDKQKNPLRARIIRNRFTKANGDTLSVIRAADLYDEGVFTTMFKELEHANELCENEKLNLNEEIKSWRRKHKGFEDGEKKSTITWRGSDMTKMQFLSYVMTLKREHSWEHIAYSETVFQDHDKAANKKDSTLPPLWLGHKLDKKELKRLIAKEYNEAVKQLSDVEKEYIRVVEDTFVKCRDVKAEGDMIRFGFENVVSDYYYPLSAVYTRHISEFDSTLLGVDRYKYASFNKHTTEATGSLLIKDVDAVLEQHINGVAHYLHTSPTIDTINKLWKLEVTKTPGNYVDLDYKPRQWQMYSLQSYVSQSKNAWRDDNGVLVGYKYIQNLVSDIMGNSPQRTGDKASSIARTLFYIKALGGNVKVLATQKASLYSATSVLDYTSVFFGRWAIWGRGMDNYSILARLRNEDNAAVKSDALVDKIGSLGEIFMKPISLFDRLNVYRLWRASQYEVWRKNGLKPGSEENRVAAGKLLDKVLRETQQSVLQTGKSESARRGNSFAKFFVQFKSDGIKNHGRLIDDLGEAACLRARINDSDISESEKNTLKARLNRVNKHGIRVITGMVINSIYAIILGGAFNRFYNKEEEDEEKKAWSIALDFVGSMTSGMPIANEIFSALTSSFNFDLSTAELSIVSDFINSVRSIFRYLESTINGKADNQDHASALKTLIGAACELCGIPFNNLYKLAYGMINKASPETAYRMDNLFAEQNYGSDLIDAMENGDMQMAAVILELAFGEKMGSGLSDKAQKELLRLSGLGESVIPTAVGDGVTVNGEERTLTGAELSQAREIYGEAIDRVNELIGSELYKSFSDEQKADAVRKIYNLYKNLAYDSVLGTEKDRKAYILSKVVDGDILCSAEVLSVIQSDKDDEGETVEGSKRKKVIEAIMGLDCTDQEKLLLIGMNGYTLASGDIPGMSSYEAKDALRGYIEGLSGISEEERLELYKACGFDVKGGDALPGTPGASDFEYELGQGNTEDAKKVFGAVITDRLGAGFSDKATEELVRLAGLSDKYSDRVMPSAISDKLTVNGSERELTKEEISAIKEKYSEAGERINAFINSSLYKSFTDEQKSAAIGKIYDLYKNIGYDSVLGTERDADALLMSKVVSGDVLCAFEALGVLTSDKDENGETISGSKRKNVLEAINGLEISDNEKLLLIAMKGYALKDGDIPGATAYGAELALYEYIGGLNLSGDERLKLYKACGFEIVDGKAERPAQSTQNSGSSSSSRSRVVSLIRGGYLANKNGTLASVAKNRARRIGKVIS